MLRAVAIGLITAVLSVLPFGSVNSAQDSERPALKYFTDVPEGWRSEVLPFPLSFAPELDYQGVEELLFAPGMFKPEAPDFFSYAFLWIADGEKLPNEEKLKKDLDLYYYGLQKAVHKPSTQPVTVKLTPLENESPDSVFYSGSIDWVEPFQTKQPQTLIFDAEFWRCDSGKQWGAYFIVVPDGTSDGVVKALKDLKYRRCD